MAEAQGSDVAAIPGLRQSRVAYDIVNIYIVPTYHYTGRLSLASTGRYWPLLASVPFGALLASVLPPPRL